jgi:hypothetical protein
VDPAHALLRTACCCCCPCADFLHDYIFLTVGRVGSSTDLIAQHVEYVQQDQKRETVLDCVKMVDVSTCSSVQSQQQCTWRLISTAEA